jgi:hypothetical protein
MMPVIEMGPAYMYPRYAACVGLAQQFADEMRHGGTPPTMIEIFTPPTDTDATRWPTKTVGVWPVRGRYLVGYDDATGLACIYRKKFGHLPAGGATNPTYQIYETTIWDKAEYDRLTGALGG